MCNSSWPRHQATKKNKYLMILAKTVQFFVEQNATLLKFWQNKSGKSLIPSRFWYNDTVWKRRNRFQRSLSIDSLPNGMTQTVSNRCIMKAFQLEKGLLVLLIFFCYVFVRLMNWWNVAYLECWLKAEMLLMDQRLICNVQYFDRVGYITAFDSCIMEVSY